MKAGWSLARAMRSARGLVSVIWIIHHSLGRRQPLGGQASAGREGLLGWNSLIQPVQIAKEPQPPSPDDGGDGDGASSPPVDLVICVVVDSEDVMETGLVECVQVASGCLKSVLVSDP